MARPTALRPSPLTGLSVPTGQDRPRGRLDRTQAVPRKQKSLGSERGLATPSPDGKAR
jgi:hypothetical protein